MSENEKELGAELPELPEADAAAAAEEAAEYYDNINKELDEELSESASKGEEPERTEDRFSFGFDINDELTEELYEFPKERGGSLIFYAACTFVAAAFLCTSFYLGAGKTADSEETQRVLELMSASDAEYAAALREQLGVRPVPVWVPAALLLAAAGLLGLFAYRVAMAPPPDAIGYAVSVTSIQLTGSGLPSWCLPVLAAAAVVAAVLLWRRCRR